MVGELLALRVRVIEVSLGVKLVLEGMVLGLNMVVIAAGAVLVGVKLIESGFIGVKLVESVFVGVRLVLEVMVVRLDMIAAVELVESVFVGIKLVESVFVGVKLVESVFVGVKLVLEVMVVSLDMAVIAAGAMVVAEV